MSKWIDAEWLAEELGDVNMDIYTNEVKEYINDAPSIEIVRCKECKKHNTHRCHMAFDLVATNDDDFCSYGERREP